jgi:hypothetical protein
MTETSSNMQIPSAIPTFSTRIEWMMNWIHCSMSAVIARRRPTYAIQNGGRQTGSILYLWNGMTYRRNSNGFTHICDHARTNGDTANVAQRRPTWPIQNGGHQTGSTLYLCNRMTVNAETSFAVVTVRKLKRVAIVRTLTTDDSANRLECLLMPMTCANKGNFYSGLEIYC